MAISSTTSTQPSTTRDTGKQLPAGEVCTYNTALAKHYTFASPQFAAQPNLHVYCGCIDHHAMAAFITVLQGSCTALTARFLAQFKTLQDATLAYSFSYPVSTDGKQLSVILSRRPERYSSAAPLAPDARQRIVSELVDFSHGLVISVTVQQPSGSMHCNLDRCAFHSMHGLPVDGAGGPAFRGPEGPPAC